ncbi:MAG: T9SS type A sorting domain-containing protein [Flavobacteriales bacterium]|nr:T9SS type A sorting domain-containing protein [Flavobacteriales bacterium]
MKNNGCEFLKRSGWAGAASFVPLGNMLAGNQQEGKNDHTDTTIALQLTQASDVRVDLYDLQGRKVATVNSGRLAAGQHQIILNLPSLGLSTANYVYQVEIHNANGIFRDCKMMTAAQ